MYYIDVILPLPLKKLFTYSVNADEAHFLKAGMRVAVPFGKAKLYSALVYSIHSHKPAYETKEIAYILDEEPVVTEKQLALWKWVAEFYMCSLGEVMRSGMPSAFLLESETIIEVQDKDMECGLFTDDEWLVYDALKLKTALKGSEVAMIVPKRKSLKVIKGLVEKGAARISERLFERYVPKLVKYIRLSPAYQSEEGLKQALELTKGARKQTQLILAYFNHINKDKAPLKAEVLLSSSGVSANILKAAEEKGIFEEYYLQKDRVSFDGDTSAKKALTPAQRAALEEITQQFASKETILLQGVTASGKTEVYIELIDRVLQSGKQVLYLLPEIGLTVHLINRLKQHFGEQMSVYHSKYNTNERVEVWNNVLHKSHKAQLVVGVRSAVMLPFSDLGLIIVDEEHDPSYRQYDPAPRYQARDTATMLAKIQSANVLLGSATPSIESMHNVKTEKYGFAYLSERYGAFQPPTIEVVDIKDKYHRKRMTGHFSDLLIEAIGERLSEGRQVILFQNQRGYAPVVQCKSCGTVPQCPHCDVSLTYHHSRNQLRCHYCGYAIAMPQTCVACGSADLTTKGFGTEQISKEASELFPNATIDRMDQDTTNGKYGYEKILSQFEQQQTQILVGTQMISKGLDFENVGLVGVMSADASFHIPDFRAYERSFQLLLQVSGRAGRSAKKGKVLIQTYNPQHPVLQQVLHSDFKGMYAQQMQERQEYLYPPLVRLVKITFKHTDFNQVNEGAAWFAQALLQAFEAHSGVHILGPEFPLISRIRNEYMKDILVKIEPSKVSPSAVKTQLLRIETSFQAIGKFRAVKVIYTVD